MHSSAVCRIALLLLAVACAADGPVATSVVVLDDLGAGRWRAVTVGERHTCALDTDGRAWCWGSNEELQLGVARTPSTCGARSVPCSIVPVPVATGRTFMSISAGGAHTCAISTDSVPFCWGSNADGQVGVAGASSAVPRIPGSAPMLAISAGNRHTCGVRTDNLLVCWGSNRFGAVGAGAGVGVPPTIVGGNTAFRDVRASDQRTCARTRAGRVMCWGAVWSHSSGDTNFTTIVQSPRTVAGLGLMADMGVGPSSTCSVDLTGFAWCWETNVNGEGGVGPGDGTATPRRIALDERLAGVSVGNGFSCGVATDGAGYCWGTNRSFQIGSTTTEFCGGSRTPCATRPLRVVGRQHFTSIAAGLGGHACGITDRFNLYCWGAGSFGQRGDGTSAALSRIPRLAVDVHRK